MSEYENNPEVEIPEGFDEQTDSYMEPELEEQGLEEGESDEQHPEPEAPRKKKSNIGQRLSEVQREKFQALDELRRTKEEMERLRGLADSSTRTALNHYDDAVNQRLLAAKENKRKALESGDINAQTDADVELGIATAEYQEANRLKAQQQMYEQKNYQQQYQQQYAPPPPTYHDPNAMYFAQEFVNENPWYDSRNEDYDQDMAGTMDTIVNGFDDNLRRAGYGHHIQRSPDYFAALRERAQELAAYKRQLGGDLNMRRTRSPVAPVRQGGFSSQNSGYPDQTKLSALERDMARHFKVDEKVYLQHRLREQKESPYKRDQRR